jgi:hypothetical protein
MKAAFAKAVATRNETVYLVHGGEDYTKQPAWYFVSVESIRARAFQKAVSSGSVNFEEYGTIIESGYGKEPPYAIIAYMRANYGYAG